MDINEPWYHEIQKLFGFEFAIKAGYFKEDKDFNFNYYDNFELPNNKIVIQMSGAFHPFHKGHFEIAMSAYNKLIADGYLSKDIVLVIHEDHDTYKKSKGDYNKSNDYSLIKNHITTFVVTESSIDNNCSRNFTRLYSELLINNKKVYFLCGGDRANFSLSFLHKGNCIVSGRDDSENYNKYKNLKGIIFIDGNNPISSSNIRCNI